MGRKDWRNFQLAEIVELRLMILFQTGELCGPKQTEVCLGVSEKRERLSLLKQASSRHTDVKTK